MALATYGGVDIFGPWVSIEHVAKPVAGQISAFFGVQGSFSQFSGTRGRTFLVEGLCLVSDLGGFRSYEATWQSLADGIARTLIDPFGYTWPNVIFQGEFRFTGRTGFVAAAVCKPYKAVMTGLT
jgi:hypothetical protein